MRSTRSRGRSSGAVSYTHRDVYKRQLILSIAFGCISYFFFRDYARASVLLAAEFNLQQAAHTMQQDLIELNSLAGQELSLIHI